MQPSPHDPLTEYEEYIGFYLEIGMAITAWAHIELALYWVTSTCFSKSNRPAAGLGFFSIDNFRSKLQFADNLVRAKYTSGKHIKDWNELHGQLESLAKIRNKLAHYHVMSYSNGKPGRRRALLSRIDKPTRFKQATPKPPSSALCIRDIMHARMRFAAAAFALEFLFYRMMRRKTQLPASLAQVRDAPTMVWLTHQMRTILTRPH